ncbi:MOSC domain-containing protein [Auraticoccus monumenti]|uniref:MOSC domain-containing protein YiiM n=1 Tax=Auraticoccus monumenti TaxID=675864 RepID=A0A1G6X458_9ACTN|nr:MOSC domain-containing protein [Auraticoccus monumenti]SDD72076.1 MOSC domain-containing protein YiiM [Auraticoccus monumenti]
MTQQQHRPDATPPARVLSVNLGRAEPNPWKNAETTGFGKRPSADRVHVRAPGPKDGGLGSGLVGDHVGDRQNHGGDLQAVYAYGAEDLRRWAERLGRELPPGAFGENLTTEGVDLADCRLGERWRVGSTELVVTVPRMPCSTFRGWLGVRGWLRLFTQDGRPGTYLSVAVAGDLGAGDDIELLHRPDHGVSVADAFRAMTTDRDGAAALAPAGAHLAPGLRELVRAALAGTGREDRLF